MCIWATNNIPKPLCVYQEKGITLLHTGRQRANKVKKADRSVRCEFATQIWCVDNNSGDSQGGGNDSDGDGGGSNDGSGGMVMAKLVTVVGMVVVMVIVKCEGGDGGEMSSC